MSIATEQAVRELQMKVAWLEREVTELKHANAELRGLVIPLDKQTLNQAPADRNGTLTLKRK